MGRPPQTEKLEKEEEAAHPPNYYPKGPIYIDKEIRLDSYLNQGTHPRTYSPHALTRRTVAWH